MADPSEIGVGTVLGGTYQVVSLLGKGGMGAVWSASHLRLPGKRVAVKVLHSASATDESYARFRREAEIASRIGHPNIVDVLDWNTLPSGTPYLVLEYLEGESLAARLAQGPIPLEETLFLVRQMGSALNAAHRAGIVHRDLKPDNIFLCPTDSGGHVAHRVKVLDFGISKIRNSNTLQTQEARVLGTPQYMAPEQARGRNTEVDERTDVFAMGAIIYEMISGRVAFEGEDLAGVIFKVVYEEPPHLSALVPGLPPAIAGAVHRALSKDRLKRQANVLELVAEVTGRPLDTLDRAALRLPRLSAEAFAATEASSNTTPPASVASATPAEVASTIPEPPRKTTRPWVWLVALVAVGGAGAGAAILVTRVSSSTSSTTTDAPARTPVVTAAPVDAGKAVAIEAAPQPDAAAAAAVVAIPAPPDAAAVAAVVETAPPDAGAVAVAVATPPDAGKAALTASPTPPRPPRPPVDEPDEPEEPEARLPKAVVAELALAEKALAGRDYQQAIRLARHSLLEQKTRRAYSIMARGYCGLKDLGNAKAALQNVGGREKVRVRRRCAAMGFSID